MFSRRGFIAGSVAIAALSSASGKLVPESEALLVNDIHSQLNSTRVLKVLEPRSLQDVQSIIRAARKHGYSRFWSLGLCRTCKASFVLREKIV